jgi:(1->4)-alpha-D-glucan 1-alpha-D-glucosylmutase
MTTLSTHDTKREEDVRARLAVLAELPREWGRQVRLWHERALTPRLYGRAAAVVDPDTEYLLWQTLVGAWPIGDERLSGYLTKAVREDKRRTSWTSPDQEYEAAVLRLATRVLDDAWLSGSVANFVGHIAADAAVNSLGAKLIQLTMPGVPDVYQGCELAGLSLVDPDNRRPVGFARTRSALSALDVSADASVSMLDNLANGTLGFLSTAKLLVTARALRLRRARPEWFAAGYQPLPATGPAAAHLTAFQRGGRAVTVVTRLPVSLRRAGGWRDTALPLPAGAWTDLLTSTMYEGGAVPAAELTRRLPVALLVPEGLEGEGR